MAISVLLPTRLRPEALKRSIDSLGKGDFEVLLAADHDDPTDYGAYSCLRMPRQGYRNLHHYYNELVKLAQGEWLLLWNDDCIMETEGWDRIIIAEEPNKVLSPHTAHDPLVTFPVVPKRFVEAVGHFSLNAHNDTWWQDIANDLGILKWIDVRVNHQRADLTGHNNDSVYMEREYQSAAYASQEMLEARQVDKQIIQELL